MSLIISDGHANLVQKSLRFFFVLFFFNKQQLIKMSLWPQPHLARVRFLISGTQKPRQLVIVGFLGSYFHCSNGKVAL